MGASFGLKAAVAYSAYKGVLDSSPVRIPRNKELKSQLAAFQKDVDEYLQFLKGYEFPDVDGMDSDALKSALDPVMHSAMDKVFGTSSPDISQAAAEIDGAEHPEMMLSKLDDIKSVVSGHIKKTREIARQYARAVRKTAN